MNLVKIIECILFISGIFLILNLSPGKIVEEIITIFIRENDELFLRVKKAKNKKVKVNAFKKLVLEVKGILEVTGREQQFLLICGLSGVLVFCGFGVAGFMGNFFLLPVLGLGLGMLPFWWVQLSAHAFQKELNNNLETALSIITSTYDRKENIVAAIEDNVDEFSDPMRRIFREFLMETQLINSNIEMGINHMKEKINNDIWREWCEALIYCQRNKGLKSTLRPIVEKFVQIRMIGEEMDYAIYNPLKELIMTGFILIGIFPFFYFMNRDWFNILLLDPLGHVIVAIDCLVIFCVISGGIKHTKPIEFRR